MSNIQICPHPLTQERNHYEVGCGLTVREMLREVGHEWVLDTRAYITLESENMVEIVTDFDTVPAPGELLAINVIPQGGGGGGKNPLGVLLSIAVIAVAGPLSTAILGAQLAGTQLIGSLTLGTLFKGVIAIGGNYLVNSIAGAQTKPPTSGITQNSQTSSIYTITGTSNALNKYGPIPAMVGGTTRIWPTLAAEPYTEVVGEDQYLRQRFAIIGPVELSDFKIGETSISEYEDVELEWIQGFAGDTIPTLYADGQDISQDSLAISLLQADGWATRTTQLQTKEIIYDITQQQLFQVNNKGKYLSTSVEYEVSCRETGTSGDWMAPDIGEGETVAAVSEEYTASLTGALSSGSSTITVNSPSYEPVYGDNISISQTVSVTFPPSTTTYTYYGTIASVSTISPDVYELSCSPVINYDYTTGADVSMLTNDGKATRVTIEGYYTNQRIFPYRFTVDEGQYDVRWRRITEDHEDDTKIFDSTSVTTLRSIAEHPGIDTDRLPPMAVIDLRIKATGQLNGVVDQLNCLASAYLPVYSGGSVTYQLSDNPAWAFFNVLYGLANKNRITDLTRYDLDGLVEWAALCESQGWKINGIIDTTTTTAKMLQTVAAVGRSSLSMVNNRYGVATDWEKDTVVQVFTPRNSWGFESTKAWPEEIHAIRAQFVDETSGYEMGERTIYADGYTSANATKFLDQEVQYITDPDQVWKTYRYQLADRILRPEIYTFTVDVENLRCIRGDRIRVVHDVMSVGLGQARIKSVTTDGSGNVETATIDSVWTLDDTTSYAYNIQRLNGQVYEGFLSNPASLENLTTVTFNPAIPAAVATVGGELIAFGEADNGVGIDAIIHEIIPGPNLTAKLVCQDYAPGVQAAADGTIPDYESHITIGRNLRLDRPDAPIINSVVSDESVIIVANDGTLITRAVISLAPNNSPIPVSGIVAQYRPDGNTLWESVGTFPAGTTTIAVNDLIDGNVCDFRVQAITDIGVASEWVYELNHTIIGKTSPPPDVENVGWSVESGAMRLSWDAVDVLDLKEYLVKDATGTELFRGRATSCSVPPQEAGAHTFTVWAIDTIEQLSETGSVVSVEVTAPGQPSVGAEIDGPNILLSWTKPTAFFPLASSEVLYGADLETATAIDAGLITTSRQVPGIAGAHRFWVLYTDAAGNVGTAGSVDITITAPGPVTVTPQVIDNNVLLSWTAPATGTLPLDGYEVRRGATWATSATIGTVGGRFTAFFEAVAGNYTYWVAAVDIAGNSGTPAPTSAVVDQPPDYVLFDDQLSALDGTLTNALAAVDGGLLMPVNTTETWAEHFTNNSWDSPQDQIDAGYTYFLEPTPATASYQETIDYGTVLAGTKVTVTPTIEIITGSVALSCVIETSEDGSTWTAFGAMWSVYATNFRYIRITITATPDGGSNDLLRLVSVRVRLDVKLRNDAGMVDCLAADVGGTEVEFNVPFVDVQSITVTPAAGGSAVYGLYDFTDAPNPDGFSVLLFDATGTRVDGSASWAAKGV